MMQSSSGVVEISNNWNQNSNRNPVPYPSQNIPTMDYQMAPPFIMQYPCGSSFPYPVNLVCNPCQRTNQRDYQSKSVAGLQVPNYSKGLPMGLYQNAIQQMPKINQYGAQSHYSGPYVSPVNCNNGCNPAVGSSLQCCPISQGVSRNSFTSTPVLPQLQNQQSYMQSSGLTNDMCCLSEYNNSFYYLENDPKCVPIPVIQCDQQEQDCQKPRQITLVREVYHFKKPPRKCSTRKCFPASSNTCCRAPWVQSTKPSRCNQGCVACPPCHNELCALQCPPSKMNVPNCVRMPGCNYTSCFSPWKPKKAFYCNGKILCVKQKRQGECVSIEKPRGCIEPTSFVREFCVQGQNSLRGAQRFPQDGEITPGPEGLLPVPPDTETRLEVVNADPNIHFKGTKKGLSRRMSKVPPIQQDDIYGANQNKQEDVQPSTSSVPFTKKT